jgi:CheY-like chemotaxis protein
VLVVDDNAQMRTIIGTVLSAIGVRQLYYAPDGRCAMEMLGKDQIDVAYVDHEMPVMNGLDFIARVRSLDSDIRYLPIIMLTGHSDRIRLDAARDRGVTEFLCKPVTAKSIVGRLNAVIMHPRGFVMAPAYFGPDRRRVRWSDYGGPRRRAADGISVEASAASLEL